VQFQAVHPAAQQPVTAQFPVGSQGGAQQQLMQNFYHQQQQQQQQQQQLMAQQAALQQKTAVVVPQSQAQPATAPQAAAAQEPGVRLRNAGDAGKGKERGSCSHRGSELGSSCSPTLMVGGFHFFFLDRSKCKVFCRKQRLKEYFCTIYEKETSCFSHRSYFGGKSGSSS
jgi:hypothetical protein